MTERYYLGGPMRGIRRFNFDEFHRVSGLIRSLGVEVFSPAERDLAIGFDPTGMTGWEDLAECGFSLRDALSADTAWICREATAVVVLDGWEGSSGARAEVALARALGLPVYAWRSVVAGCPFDLTVTPTPAVDVQPEVEGDVEGDVESVLHEAERLIHGARQGTYGHPADDFARTALHWQAVLGVEVSALQVALCMIGVKLSRLTTTPDHRDSIVDVAGYAGCYDLILERGEA